MAEAFEGLSVEIVRSTWGVHESMVAGKWDVPGVIAKWEGAVERLKSHACRVVYPLEAEDAGTLLSYKEQNAMTISYGEFPDMVKDFIASFHPNSEIASLGDIIAWNKKHAEKALPKRQPLLDHRLNM
ncbi:Fc.00g002590.m01.CDS01 [Cosmosporella sp. VM-42]